MRLIKPLRFITSTFLYFVTVSTMLVYTSDPEIFFDWTVSYAQRAPLGVNKQDKDQIGTFFYFPSLHFQKAAGGFGAIRVNNRAVIPIPFSLPYQDFDVLIGDWYNADYQMLRASLDVGNGLPMPDGILINGLGPNEATFDFQPGATYRLRISNVGLKTSINFKIKDHLMSLVQTEGSYTTQDDEYDSLDIHDTPLKLADYFRLSDVFDSNIMFDTPNDNVLPVLGTPVVDAMYHDYVHVVYQNPLQQIQTWHLDGYNFFVVGMGFGTWDESKKELYNLFDSVSRSTIQVYPLAWTTILVKLDNEGMWNLRSQNAENWYLGQELYIRVKGIGQDDTSTIPIQDEARIPENVIKCGKTTSL
nr:monocopper oxidase-like protein sku5 [Quercus suber]